MIEHSADFTETKEGYIEVPGGKVWYKIVGSQSPKPPLLILHGGPGFTHDSLETLEGLVDERQLVYYDQLGAGKSDRPTDKSLWNIDRFLAELIQVRELLGLERFHLLGHSWGSLLVAQYALSEPEGLTSLILSGPLLSVQKWIADAEKLKRQLPTEVQEVIDKHEAGGTTDSEEYKEATLEFYKKFYCRIYPYPEPVQRTQRGANLEIYETMWGPSEFYCSGNLKGYDITDQVSKIRVPVIFTCGRYDEATPQTTQYYQSLIPNAQIAIFEQSAHLPFVEENENYVKVVREFLQKVDY